MLHEFQQIARSGSEYLTHLGRRGKKEFTPIICPVHPALPEVRVKFCLQRDGIFGEKEGMHIEAKWH